MTKTNSLLNSPTQFNAITGLSKKEFMDLLYHFAPIVEEHYRHYDMKGQRRKMIRYQERSDSSLTGPVNKLLFILSYMKENPNQAYHGVMFSMSQGKVSLWVNQLSFLLKEALKKMGKIPNREANKFYNFLYAYVEVVMFMDVAERRIGRSPDYQVQKDHYSGKKGHHTLKNLLIANLEGEIIYLGETFEGSVHDKSMYDQAELKFPDQWHSLWVDLGFLGLKAEGVEVYMPEKKPKGKKLSNFQKELNTLIASIRVKVEHAIAGVKRLKIIRNQIRLHGWQKRDRMMNIACGLHNLRCQRWAA
ncbi:MAG: HARBI1 family protein [Cyclobacteriaceae bacterium]